jgi:anti-anti-sigma regulatory factor
MTIESSRRCKVAAVTLGGRMDAESAPQLVSSMGLRSFLVFAKQTRVKGGAVILCGMKGFVREVFHMTHVTQLFPLFNTTEAAVQSI